MAITTSFPQHACEHLDDRLWSKLGTFRASHVKHLQQGSANYLCVQCSAPGSLITLDKHLSKSKHGFAVSLRSTYCGHCKDLVYEADAKKRKLLQMEEDDDSYMTSNASQKACGREGVRGLFNLGETCYMNAVLQMMIHNQLLSSYFLGSGHPVHTCPISKIPDKKADSDSDEDDEDDEPRREHKVCVACAMTEVFSDAKMADVSVPAWAVNLLYASWKAIPHMAGKGQQDAQEWFIMIVDKLHESVRPSLDKKGRCRCFFHKVFFGRLYSEVTCDTCQAVSRMQEPYSSISLDFKKQVKKKKKSLPPDVKTAVPNILECLKAYTTPESLPAEEYKCRNCGVPRSASKRLRIRKLPAILCVHVKRFGTKVVNNVYMEEKYGGKIDFPLTLNMSPFTTSHSANDARKFTYDLECVVVHQGEHIQNGHYFAFCKQDDRWFRFDDEIVTATTTEDVLRQEAYLLFYSLRLIGKPRGQEL